MFDVKMNGRTATVSRSLNLPATGVLKSFELKSTFKVDCDIGIDPKEPTAKLIYEDFLKRYRKDLDARGKARLSEYTKIWKDAERDLHANMHDRREFVELSEELYAALNRKWSSFKSDDAVKAGLSALDAAITAAVNAGRTDRKSVKPKVKLGDKGNETDRKGFLNSLLAIAAGGAIAGPAGAAGAAVVAVPKGMLALQKINWRKATDAPTNAADIQRDLTAAKKAMDALTPSVALLKKNRAALNLQIVEVTRALKKDVGELAEQAKANRAHKSVAAELAKSAKAAAAIHQDLAQQAKEVEKLGSLIAAIEAAQKSVDLATERATIEIKGWQGVLRKFETISDDANTVVGTLQALVKTLG